MLIRSHRLRDSEDIRAVLRFGEKIVLPYAEIAIKPKEVTGAAKAAVIVGRKVSASAVKRHRIQRQLRHLVRRWLTQYPRGYDMVVLGTSQALDGVLDEQSDVITEQVVRVLAKTSA